MDAALPVRLLLVVTLCWHPAGAVRAQFETQVEERLTDAQGAAAAAPARKGSWLVVPVPVANPTVGNGLQAAVLYLHAKRPGEETAPQTTTGGAAMRTDSQSWLAGIFHDASLSGDRYRLNAAAAVGEFHLRFYGVGSESTSQRRSFPYRFGGTVAQLRVESRLPGTDHWFAGLNYLLLRARVSFEANGSVPEVGLDSQNAALGPHVTYDSRSSNYYPLRGQYFRAQWMNYAPVWGSDLSYDKVDVFYNRYLPLAPQAVLALRARFQDASAGTPFYGLPTLDMRGFSRDRYRDRDSLSLTAEGRYKFTARWGMIAFVEAGRTADSPAALSDARTITSYGAGARWQVTSERDMHLGLDFAISTDDRAVFIQIGERF